MIFNTYVLRKRFVAFIMWSSLKAIKKKQALWVSNLKEVHFRKEKKKPNTDAPELKYKNTKIENTIKQLTAL